jgi:hypothetical protein
MNRTALKCTLSACITDSSGKLVEVAHNGLYIGMCMFQDMYSDI